MFGPNNDDIDDNDNDNDNDNDDNDDNDDADGGDLKLNTFQSRLNALNAECMNYFHQVNTVMTTMMMVLEITTTERKPQNSSINTNHSKFVTIHSDANDEVDLQDISPSFYHVQKPKAFLRPIITNLGNECIDPNISAENRQRSVQWITTELRKQTAR